MFTQDRARRAQSVGNRSACCAEVIILCRKRIGRRDEEDEDSSRTHSGNNKCDGGEPVARGRRRET